MSIQNLLIPNQYKLFADQIQVRTGAVPGIVVGTKVLSFYFCLFTDNGVAPNHVYNLTPQKDNNNNFIKVDVTVSYVLNKSKGKTGIVNVSVPTFSYGTGAAGAYVKKFENANNNYVWAANITKTESDINPVIGNSNYENGQAILLSGLSDSRFPYIPGTAYYVAGFNMIAPLNPVVNNSTFLLLTAPSSTAIGGAGNLSYAVEGYNGVENSLNANGPTKIEVKGFNMTYQQADI